MKRNRPNGSEIVDRAFSALRETPVPEGPSPQVLSAVLDAGNVPGNELQPITIQSRRVIMIKRITKVAAAVAVVVGIYLGIPYITADRNGNAVLAKALQQAEQAKTVTWTQVFYEQVSSEDGKEVWIVPKIKKHMYKAPGLTRTVHLDEQGQVGAIIIRNHVRGVRLSLQTNKKKAWLISRGKQTSFPPDMITQMRKRIGPDAKSLGTRQIDGRKAKGYRVTRFGDPDWSADLWVDAKTNRLVRIHNPGLDKYDPENDPDRNNPPGKKAWLHRGMGSLYRDIVFDQELDDSLFSVEPPAGYVITTTRVAEPTEADMLARLRLVAECNGNVFPESPNIPPGIVDKVLKKRNAGEKLSSPIEQKVFEVIEDWSGMARSHHPVHRFAANSTGGTWTYVGEGVKLDDKDAVVCWYRPKDSTTYRVVYGDLRVKVVNEENLPSKPKP